MSFEEVSGQIINSVADAVNESEIGEGFAEGLINSLPQNVLEKLSVILNISKWFLIILIIYFVILIIKSLMRIRDSSNLRVIARNSSEINKKLDSILHKDKKEDKHRKD